MIMVICCNWTPLSFELPEVMVNLLGHKSPLRLKNISLMLQPPIDVGCPVEEAVLSFGRERCIGRYG